MTDLVDGSVPPAFHFISEQTGQITDDRAVNSHKLETTSATRQSDFSSCSDANSSAVSIITSHAENHKLANPSYSADIGLFSRPQFVVDKRTLTKLRISTNLTFTVNHVSSLSLKPFKDSNMLRKRQFFIRISRSNKDRK